MTSQLPPTPSSLSSSLEITPPPTASVSPTPHPSPTSSSTNHAQENGLIQSTSQNRAFVDFFKSAPHAETTAKRRWMSPIPLSSSGTLITTPTSRSLTVIASTVASEGRRRGVDYFDARIAEIRRRRNDVNESVRRSQNFRRVALHNESQTVEALARCELGAAEAHYYASQWRMWLDEDIKYDTKRMIGFDAELESLSKWRQQCLGGMEVKRGKGPGNNEILKLHISSIAGHSGHSKSSTTGRDKARVSFKIDNEPNSKHEGTSSSHQRHRRVRMIDPKVDDNPEDAVRRVRTKTSHRTLAVEAADYVVMDGAVVQEVTLEGSTETIGGEQDGAEETMETGSEDMGLEEELGKIIDDFGDW